MPIYVKFEDKKIVLGTLSADKFPQISFDLVFEKEFELSHNWNGGSVYFMGYKSVVSDEYPLRIFHMHSNYKLLFGILFYFILDKDATSVT